MESMDGVIHHATHLISHIKEGNYIAVGSIVIEGSTYTDWTDIEKPDCDILRRESKTPLTALLKAKWIRAHARNHAYSTDHSVVRVYLLPDDVGRGVIPREDHNLRLRLHQLMSQIDASNDAFQGCKAIDTPRTGYQVYSEDDDSLFYILNTVPSRDPQSLNVTNAASQAAIDSLFEPEGLRGLQTALYPFQKRSAATMIRREVQPHRSLDPRLSPAKGPCGQAFYYDCQTGQIYQQPKLYEEVRGGILSESMGLGKTLISLATIYATKGHW